MAIATAPQRHRVRRLLLLFALLAAVFAMHSLDATPATAAPTTTTTTAPMAIDMPMDMPMPGMPDHATSNACHGMAQMAGVCLGLLAAGVAIGRLQPRRGTPLLRTSPPGHPTSAPGRAPRTPAPPGPPDLTVLSICRT